MSEHLRGNEGAPRHGEIERAAAERIKQIERGHERHHDHLERQQKIEAAREQLSKLEPEAAAAPEEKAPIAEPTGPKVLTKAANYRHTMASLRHRLKPASRSFSRFIHNPGIEKTSEVVGATVLRPSVSLGATTTATLLTGFLYLYARHNGFPLRGSEIWLTLLVGAALGLVLELVWKLTKRLLARS